MTKAIYAGSFDPVTYGHIEIINKACKLFEKVYILVANNPSKKHLLSIEDRIALMKSSTSDKNVEVVSLNCGDTVAYQAKKMGVNYLVRGLRGHTDVDGEMAAARINREITDNLETVIFVPEIYHEDLSSSLVRSMVGLRNWKTILKDRVPDAVIKKLSLVHFDSLLSNSIIGKSTNSEWLCKKMNRPYHNIEHSYNVLYNVYYDAHYDVEKEAVVLASAFHDVEPSEEDSFDMLRKKIDESNKNFELCSNLSAHHIIKRAYELIMATDHSKSLSKDQLKDEVLCDFVAADLMILASSKDDYNNYSELIRKEYSSYSDEEYCKGRISFLNKLLEEKRTIFPDLNKYRKLEAKAHENIVIEINKLKGKI